MGFNLDDMLMSIRFSDPEMSYFLEKQMMNDNWEKVTQILNWSIECGFITKLDRRDGTYEYDCNSKVVENMLRKLLTNGRGSYFAKQDIATQAIFTAVFDKGSNIPRPSLPQPPQPPPSKQKPDKKSKRK